MIIKLIVDCNRNYIAVDKQGNKYNLKFTARLRDRFTYYKINKDCIINNTINTLDLHEMEINEQGKLVLYKSRTQADFEYYNYLATKCRQLKDAKENEYSNCIHFRYKNRDCDLLVRNSTVEDNIKAIKKIVQKIINSHKWIEGYETKFKDVVLKCVDIDKSTVTIKVI